MNRQASIMDIDRALVIAQRRCSDMGVTVKFCPKATTAYTDGKNITLPFVGQPVSTKSLDKLYGMVIHECGHHLRPEAFDVLKTARPPEHVCALFNITEDDGMERERALEWGGDAKALGTMNSIILDEVVESWHTHFASGMPKGQDPNPMAAMLIGQLSRVQWDEESRALQGPLFNAVPKEVRELVATLEKEGWVQRFRDTVSVTDTWDTAIDLAKRLYPNNDQNEYEEIREYGHKGIAGDGGATRRDDSSTTMADGLDGKGGKKRGKSEDTTTEGHCVSWKDVVLSQHNEWSEDNPNKKGGSMGITWEDFSDKTAVAIMPSNQAKIVDWNKVNSGLGSSHKFLGNNAKSRAFASKIRRYIQAQARSKIAREKYNGRLDRQGVVRLLMPPIDGGEWNKKIFYEQTKGTTKDTAIFVLVDWSGSMRGHKMEYAADTAQRLIHTFDRVLNIPVGLAAFTNRGRVCYIGPIKGYNERGITQGEIASRFAKMSTFSSGNADADAITWSYGQLLKRKETRKILMVLSDGSPSSSWGGHPDSALKQVTKQIEKDNRVELYGVGIEEDSVKNYYTNYKVVRDASNINETLFTLIKEGAHGRRKGN